jgi:uncharacterized protein (PEP-CTERM system associated)
MLALLCAVRLGVLRTIAGIIGMAALTAGAQEAAVRSGLSVIPELGIRQTATDNVNLSSTDRRFELITELSPELRLSSNSGRVRGYLDYALTGVAYARSSSANNVQQSLSALGTAEAIDNWAYVDASANISQQNILALGTQSSDSALINANRSEVASFRLSPYFRGRLGSFADYQARLAWATTKSKDADADSTSTEASLQIGEAASSLARIGWSANLSHQVVDFGVGGQKDSDRLNAVLTFAVSPELKLSALGGREINDLYTLKRQGYKSWGWGTAWFPSERTRLEATLEHRFFGSSHNIRFEHRMPRSIVTFSDTQDVSTDAFTGGAAAPRTVFDLLFEQFASIVPDPVQRAALVDAFLQNNGLTRTTLATGGFLTSAPSVQRAQNLSVALLGVRTTVIATMFRNDARPLDPATIVTGNLSNGSTLHQRGESVNVSHRLTPQSALSVDLTHTKTRTTEGDQSTDLRSLTATWSSQLRERVNVSLSARWSSFDSATNPYTEHALIGNLRLRF